MKKKLSIRRGFAIIISLIMIIGMTPASVMADTDASSNLDSAWTEDQDYTLADPAPWNLKELKQVVDVNDPRSVAAYWAWSVTRLVDDYDDGMEMMKYLFADIEVFGRGYYEGGMSGKAGWDSYFNERLKSPTYKWLPRAYFNGASSSNAYKPTRPLTLELYYNKPNTDTINSQTFKQLGRLNIVYWVKSYAAGNQVNITLSKFEDSDRWYVTSGTSASALFYGQSAAGSSQAGKAVNDDSTAEEHYNRYGGTPPTPKPVDNKPTPADNQQNKPDNPIKPNEQPNKPDPTIENPPVTDTENPFTDVPEDSYFTEAVKWAVENNITTGISATTFGPNKSCTRGEVVTFLWRASGKPEPESAVNPFSDVKASDYYYKPILWAVEKGITTGTSAKTFSPKQKCSSAHIITFMYRAKGIGSDGWYQAASKWAKEQGLLEDTGIIVSPSTMCPRAAVITFMYRGYTE